MALEPRVAGLLIKMVDDLPYYLPPATCYLLLTTDLVVEVVDEALPLLLRCGAIEAHVVAAVLPLHVALGPRPLLEDRLEQIDQVEALPAGPKAVESTTWEAAGSSTLKQCHGAKPMAWG